MSSDCIFCKMAAGELRTDLVYESPEAIAFLDKHPVARGHALVIPRAHAPTLLELEDGSIGGLFRAVKTVTRKIRDTLHPLAFNVGWNHGADAGQRVFHLHVHILPRYSPGGFGIQALGEGAAQVNFGELTAAIRNA
ncbi:MAG TPA: HIT domain-containing protein [Myxococcaceae bacterium]|nr:HIT domain-containing protein [Myxococcaceae bacterium]